MEIDDTSLLTTVLIFVPLLDKLGLTKASPIAGRGLEGLAANVLLAPMTLDEGLEEVLVVAGCSTEPLNACGVFDGVVSMAPLALLLVGGRLFGTYELTARLLGVVLVNVEPVGRFVGDVARGAMEGMGGIGGRWPWLVAGRD